MKQLLTFFTIALLTGACGNAPEKTPVAITDTTAKQLPAAPASPDWYKRYEGTVAGLPVVAQIHKYGTTITGSYYYTKTGESIELRNWTDSTKDDNEWLLEERPVTESPEDNNAYWLLTAGDAKLTGTWHKAGGQAQPIELHEAISDGSLNMTLLYLADSARYIDTAAQPQAMAKISLLQPAGDMADAPRAFLENALRDAIGCTGDSLDAKGCMKQSNDNFFREWRKMMAETDSMGDDISAQHNNYTMDEYQTVRYNDGGWLVVEHMQDSYTGGAHGNYASSFLNLDWQSQQAWSLTEVFNKRDTANLVPLLQARARQYFKIGKSESLGSYLFESKIPVTSTFYLGPQGITFLYNPYEIAAYAAGQIHLYLPYSEVKQWLTKEFKARMGIM